ncbi:RagB/SusD family nutrient uptake outer membrane protein [Chitinophaga lutea]|uniref:RagB/SusD family nutrient uptake outer membrane protein n=1 Tax=Chitinophaga lutea TaxID=2488634 RepID=A0A3N4Q1A9_9BACT|nr:RagB/SusD family nutrient uptake outer membrane protein [Chitinophaga lutea]RPE12969.1 RagB/SusD family nutrient uptake outer membrane protein [Chitinophaga lutea]
MKNRILYVMATCTLLGLMSCKKYLQEKMVSEVTYPHYDTEEGLESAVTAVYSQLRSPLGSEQIFSFGDFGTDTYTEGQDGGKNFNRYNSGLSPTQGMISGYWQTLYRGINTANICIERIPGIPGKKIFTSDQFKRERIAEMRFLRAYFYFVLVQSYGRVPILPKGYIEVVTDFKRAAVKDVYKHIISDLRTAVDSLPVSQTDGGRATKGAAQHLLSKVYLTRASAVAEDRGKQPTDLDSAAYLAEQVIASPEYALEKDYASIFRFGNERNDEVIFAVQFAKDPIYNGDGNQMHLFYIMYYDNHGGMMRDIANGRAYRRLRPTNYQIDVYNRKTDSRFYKSYKMTWICNNPNNIPIWDAANAPSPDLVGKPKFKLKDTAVYVTVSNGTDAQIAKKPYTWIPRNKFTGNNYPTLNKYLDPGRADLAATVGNRDYVLMRLGETYLLAAEAYARKGEYQKAADLVNVVRKRAAYKEGEIKPKEFWTVEGGNIADIAKSTETDMQVTAANISANVINFFLDERARELNGECWRWYDLVRMEKLVERVKQYNSSASGIREYHKLRPIPLQHIERLTNPGPLSEEQNEGYY